jgi:hypothetical protein
MLSNKKEKLNITSCTITKNNGIITYYSIMSLVNIIDEILIFDDSTQYNYNTYIYDLASLYDNIKIVKKDFGKDLGKKKNYLSDISKNKIIIRWDDDFILYDVDLLHIIYNNIKNDKYNGIITYNPNIYTNLYNINKQTPYCMEIYIYSKEIISFKEVNGYNDFPVITIGKDKLKLDIIKKPLFIHLSNLKSIEQLSFRTLMTPYFCDKKLKYENIYYYQMKYKNIDVTNYTDVINYKSNMLAHISSENSKIDKLDNIYNYLNKDKYDEIISKFSNINDIFKPNIIGNEYNLINYPKTYANTNLYWFGNLNNGNFGDLLSPYLFHKITGFMPTLYDAKNNSDKLHYITLGSILQHSNHNSVVWGTGSMHKTVKTNCKNILCTRGPLTQNILLKNKIECPSIFGDPGLLLQKFYRKSVEKKYKIGVIPHTIDYKYATETIKDPNILIIKLYIKFDDIEKVIDQINSCELLFSSSLHGIIIPNTYNVPVLWIENIKLQNDNTKFVDYFMSVHSQFSNFIYNEKNITDVAEKFKVNMNFSDINISKYDEYLNLYIKPDLIQQRIKDLIYSCPFIEDNLQELLYNQ